MRLDPEGCHLFPAEATTDGKDSHSPATVLTA
jgi:hypothetical protein